VVDAAAEEKDLRRGEEIEKSKRETVRKSL